VLKLLESTVYILSGLAVPLAVAGGIPVLFAQHGGDYERADIERGAQLYAEFCSNCHGDEGDGVGNVNLKVGQFRQASTDQNFRRILTRGIPGTAMPPGDYDDGELVAIIAYVRNMRDYDGGVVTLGNADRGRAVFEGKGDCTRCHRVAGRGSRLAPDLTAIGAMRGAGSMREKLIDPTGSMLPFNKPLRIVTQDGETVTGRRLNEDTYTIQLLDEEERLRSFDKTTLRELTVLTMSPMPSYAESLTETELADLLAYLVTRKGL
jgi:putative heme-binding domain-containing protein